MKKVFSIAQHLLVLVILGWLFWPFAQKYLFASHPSGNDYYVGLNYVEFFHKYLAWPPASWENFWYSGEPAIRGYPWLYFYLMQPLAHFFGSAWAMEIYSVVALFLFFVFSYFLFWELSKNKLFSLVLTFLLLNSRGLFNALPWNGFIVGSATQMFLPLVVYLVIRFWRTKKQKFLLFAGLMAGLAIMGHPLTGGFFVVIPSLILLLFWKDEAVNFWSIKKIGYCFSFGLVALLVASPVFYSLISFFSDKLSSGRCQSEACWGDIPVLIRSINPLLYALFIILIGLGLILKIFRKKFELRLSLIFLIPLVFLLGFFTAAKLDLISSLSITVWPERVTWTAAFFLASLCATMLGSFFPEKSKLTFVPSLAILLIMGVIWSQGWFKEAVFLDFSSVFSGVGAYPGENYLYATDKYRKKDVSEVLPSWLAKDENNYRFECQVYEINFWWNLAVDVPATRGYVHFFRKHQMYWYGWLTAGLTDFWGEKISRAKEVSQNTARFLLDWNAIRFLEDSNRRLKKDNPYADFLIKEPISDRREGIGELLFYRIAEKETSPIVKASNAKTILVVGLKESFVYDNITKVLAAENLNSQFLIPIRGPDNLDELEKYRLADFDVIFLNDYRYKDFKSWRVLADYVKAGGKLIIETGTQVRESDSATLPEGETKFPEVFPMEASKRESLGTAWQLTKADHPVLAGIDFNQFGPLEYEETSWKVSFVPTQTDLKPGAEVILSQQGRPVLVSRKLGQGEVIWSGLNLPYHFLYYDRLEEARFFKNIIAYLSGGLPQGEVAFSLERKRPERVRISGQDFSGVVFKEFFDSGWRAKVNGQNAEIYPAGPDFMYVRVPKGVKGEIKIEFFYRGTNGAWFFFLLSLGTIGVTIYFLIFGKGLFSKGLRFGLSRLVNKKISSWWSKEEEE